MSSNKIKKLEAFTLAEVLITLAIIGVVAALTIPTLVTNYQKKMYVTQLKKSYNNLTNGFKTTMAKEGVTKLSDTTLWSKIPDDRISTTTIFNEKGKDFFDEFKKTFKVINAYGGNNLPKKYKSKIYPLSAIETNKAGSVEWFYIKSFRSFFLVLADGITIEFDFWKNPNRARWCGGYSKYCSSLKEFQTYRNTSSSFWEYVGTVNIDVNGIKEPNKYGRDYYNFYISNDGTLIPYGSIDYAIYAGSSNDYKNNYIYWNGKGGTDKVYGCSTKTETYGETCAARIIEEGWKMTY